MNPRISYLLLRIAIIWYKSLAFILGIWFRVFPSKKSKNIILFPHAQPGSDGFLRRFEEYLPFFKNSGINVFVANVSTDDEEFKNVNSSNTKRSRYIRKCLSIRFWQVVNARKFNTAFVQRGLFLFYYDDKSAFLERLLKTMNVRIIVDYWDSVWVRNPDLVKNTVRFADTISVVNQYLYEYFVKVSDDVRMFPIGVNLSRYIIKSDYKIEDPVIFIYTGQPGNVEHFLKNIRPVLLKLGERINYILRIISKARIYDKDIKIEYYDFDINTFFNFLATADIGLYHIEDSVVSRGKLAMKVLDYMSAGLPIVASPYGLSPHVKENENVVIAETETEWFEGILHLIKDKRMREEMGKKARRMVQDFHELSITYNIYSDILK